VPLAVRRRLPPFLPVGSLENSEHRFRLLLLINGNRGVMPMNKYLDAMIRDERLDAQAQYYWTHEISQERRKTIMHLLEMLGLKSITINADGKLTWSR
jgi:hypothetical protein